MSDPRSNRKSLFAGTALALGILLLVSVNLLGNSVLRNLRVDLTEDKLFTLSDGTKDMLSTLEEPLLLRFYMNQNLANEFPSIRDYGRRVRDVLAEYVAASSSKISLEILNPEPFSDTEDDAVSYGLQGVPVDAAGDRLYFGLVGTNTVDEKSVIEFFRQEREPFLEYDLTRLIHEISTVAKPVVGVVSSLPIYGGPGNPQVGEPAYKPAWAVITQLEQMFQVRQINLDAGPVEEDVDILMLVHPSNLTGIARYEIDQFVLGGGRALVFVDPLSEESAKTPDPDNPLAPKNSTLPDLFKAWGVELVPGMLVADARAAQRVQTSEQGRSVVVPYLPWLSLELPNFNPEEVATSQLGRVTMRSAGRLEPVADSEVAFVPLIQSSPESMMLERFYVQFGGNPTALLDRFEAQGIPYTLAARLHGIVDSAFPNGPMKDEDSTSGSDGPPEPLGELPDNHISQSTEPINVVVVSDTDMLVDSTWVQTQQFMGRALTMPMADNGAFCIGLNCNIYIDDNQLCPPYPDCLTEEDIGYQDTSECPPECDLGDVNCDGTLNVLDIVTAVNIVLANEYDDIADVNGDGELNILDLVTLVNWVLFGNDDACIDYDGNIYLTVQIGEQLWMAENLKVAHYNNGDEIPTGYSNLEWSSNWDDAYAIYNDDPANAAIFGNLYNWYAVDDYRGICPENFHIPSDDEWHVVLEYLGGSPSGSGKNWLLAGGKMKNIGTIEAGDGRWYAPNKGANNESGFTAIPGGFRLDDGQYLESGYYSIYWSSTAEYYSDIFFIWYLLHDESRLNRGLFSSQVGLSVRCLAD